MLIELMFLRLCRSAALPRWPGSVRKGAPLGARAQEAVAPITANYEVTHSDSVARWCRPRKRPPRGQPVFSVRRSRLRSVLALRWMEPAVRFSWETVSGKLLALAAGPERRKPTRRSTLVIVTHDVDEAIVRAVDLGDRR